MRKKLLQILAAFCTMLLCICAQGETADTVTLTVRKKSVTVPAASNTSIISR